MQYSSNSIQYIGGESRAPPVRGADNSAAECADDEREERKVDENRRGVSKRLAAGAFVRCILNFLHLPRIFVKFFSIVFFTSLLFFCEKTSVVFFFLNHVNNVSNFPRIL